jgi:integrase
MASINSRNGKLYLDFRYKGKRCREQTLLKDNAVNRRKTKNLLARIEAEIMVGTFVYEKYFPNSPMVEKWGQEHDPGCPLFSVFAWEWFHEVEPTWRRSYAKTIKQVLEKRIIDAFGDCPVNAIKKSDILKFRALLAKVTNSKGKGLSPSYINRQIKLIGMILEEAAERFNFMSPCRGIKAMKLSKTAIEPFSLTEVKNILHTVREDYEVYYTVRFLTGMRSAEIDGLQWKYVDFERRQILVRQTWVEGRVESTKTNGSQREIDMSIPVYDALKTHFKVTGRHQSYVFLNRCGKPLNRHNVTNRVWYPLLRHLNLARRRPYQTRHTAATLWLASGENPEWIARQMGHSSTEMLFRVYSRYVPNLTRRDGSAMERLLSSTLTVSQPPLEVSE